MQYYNGQSELDLLEQKILAQERAARLEAAGRAMAIGRRDSINQTDRAFWNNVQPHRSLLSRTIDGVSPFLDNMLPANRAGLQASGLGTALEALPWLIMAARTGSMATPVGFATNLASAMMMGAATDAASNNAIDAAYDGLSYLMNKYPAGDTSGDDYNWDAITPNVDMNMGYTTP